MLEEIKKDADRKNTFFIRNNGVLKAYKLEVTDYMARKIDKYDNFDVMNTIFRNKSEFAYNFFEILFHGHDGKPRRRLPCIFTIGDKSALTDLHPIAVNLNRITIKGGVDLFITPELYAQKKSIFKRSAEVSSITVTQNELKTIRSQLNDNDFTFSKLYQFRSKFEQSYYAGLSIDDIVIPDFNVSIKVKSKKDEKVDDI